MRLRAVIGFSVALFCSAVFAQVMPSIVIAPFDASGGVSREYVDAFATRLADCLAVGGEVCVSDNDDLAKELARRNMFASDLLFVDAVNALSGAAGADYIAVGTLSAFEGCAVVAVTLVSIEPPDIAAFAVRSAEGFDALMETIPGLCAELMEVKIGER